MVQEKSSDFYLLYNISVQLIRTQYGLRKKKCNVNFRCNVSVVQGGKVTLINKFCVWRSWYSLFLSIFLCYIFVQKYSLEYFGKIVPALIFTPKNLKLNVQANPIYCWLVCRIFLLNKIKRLRINNNITHFFHTKFLSLNFTTLAYIYLVYFI